MIFSFQNMTNVDNGNDQINMSISLAINETKIKENLELENSIQENSNKEKETFNSNSDMSDQPRSKGKKSTFSTKKNKLDKLTNKDTNVPNSDIEKAKEETSGARHNPFFDDKVDEYEVMFNTITLFFIIFTTQACII